MIRGVKWYEHGKSVHSVATERSNGRLELKEIQLLLMEHDQPDHSIQECTDLLIEILRFCVDNSATDARDHVYGLLPLFQLWVVELRPMVVDYSKPVAEVFEDFIRLLIEYSGNLRCLYVACDSEGRLENRPSWVADFSSVRGIPGCKVYSYFHGSVKQTDVSAEGPHHGHICLQGKVVGKIKAIGPSLTYAELNGIRPNLQAISEAKDFLLRFTSTKPRRMLENLSEVRSRWNDPTSSRMLFATVPTGFGATTHDVLCGDLIVQFLGGWDPFILRAKGSNYELVGYAITPMVTPPFKWPENVEFDSFTLV